MPFIKFFTYEAGAHAWVTITCVFPTLVRHALVLNIQILLQSGWWSLGALVVCIAYLDRHDRVSWLFHRSSSGVCRHIGSLFLRFQKLSALLNNRVIAITIRGFCN